MKSKSKSKKRTCKSCGKELLGIMLVDPDLCFGCVFEKYGKKSVYP